MNKAQGIYRLSLVIKWVGRFFLFLALCSLIYVILLKYGFIKLPEILKGVGFTYTLIEGVLEGVFYWVVAEGIAWALRGFASKSNE